MFWKIEALTAKRSSITLVLEGNLEDVKNHAISDGVEILDVSPDYVTFIKSIFENRKLSLSALAVFFKEFADMQRCGLSVNEALSTLNEQT